MPLGSNEHPADSANQHIKTSNESSVKLKILVVDDNVDAANSLASYLEVIGHEVSVEHDGASAIKKAELYQPHVILLDTGMPGLNGYEVATYIRKQSWDKPIRLVAITGWGQAEDRQKSAQAGFDAHFVKLVDLKILTNLLSEFVVN